MAVTSRKRPDARRQRSLRAACIAGAGLLFLAGCVAPREFVPVRQVSATVVWREAGMEKSAPARLETDSRGDVRLIVEDVLVVTRLRDASGDWAVRGSLGSWRGFWNTAPERMEGWILLAEVWSDAGRADPNVSEVRTGRYSAAFERENGRLAGLALVSVTTGARYQLRID